MIFDFIFIVHFHKKIIIYYLLYISINIKLSNNYFNYNIMLIIMIDTIAINLFFSL